MLELITDYFKWVGLAIVGLGLALNSPTLKPLDTIANTMALSIARSQKLNCKKLCKNIYKITSKTDLFNSK